MVRCAEDVIHTLVEILPMSDGVTREKWVLDLERQKEKLHSSVLYVLQTLRAAASYPHYYNKVRRERHLEKTWYTASTLNLHHVPPPGPQVVQPGPL